jgi:3-phosphoshikimate 1-carboxyvinyltransferase
LRVKINGPQKVKGTVEAPSSKAYTHRALVTSLLANGMSTVEKPLFCDDTNSTRDAIQSLGARIAREGETILIEPGPQEDESTRIDCGESGATLRFLAAVSATFPTETILVSRGSLPGRPLLPLTDALRALGANVITRRDESISEVRVRGPLKGGFISISGNVSSQFVSALLLAAPLASTDVEIRITTDLESRPYVEMTLAIMKMHQVKVETIESGFHVAAPQSYLPAKHLVPTDFSSAAFLLAAGIISGEGLELTGVRETIIEPDSTILEILKKMEARLENSGNRIRVLPTPIEGFRFDARDHPDLVPVLEVLACQAKGRSEIRGVGRLVFKESDRLKRLPEELGKMGARITFFEDCIAVEGGHRLSGGDLRSHHDHRVAMACATASLAAEGTTMIDDAEAVSKSYPGFYGDLGKLGVNLLVE